MREVFEVHFIILKIISSVGGSGAFRTKKISVTAEVTEVIFAFLLAYDNKMQIDKPNDIFIIYLKNKDNAN